MMASCELKVIRWLYPVLLSLTLFSCQSHQQWVVVAEPQVPCYFIFGDSLSDSGNNNPLPFGIKANYRPYGVDFPNGTPTGRFCNGRTIVDIIGQFLGFETFIPPFKNATGDEILKGVNYASGSSGIRNDTLVEGLRIALDAQLTNHQTTVSGIEGILGSAAAATDHLNKCIYSVNSGTNDYILNYFFPLSPIRLRFTPEQFATVLIQRYSQQLKILYDHGARKVALYGLAQLGCMPFQMAIQGISTGCAEKVNDAVAIFNNKLRSLVDELNNSLLGANFTYINAFTALRSLLGPVVTRATCCELVPVTGLCVPFGSLCSNRTSAVFFDAIHPTEASNLVFARLAYNAPTPLDAHPYDISQLAVI